MTSSDRHAKQSSQTTPKDIIYKATKTTEELELIKPQLVEILSRIRLTTMWL